MTAEQREELAQEAEREGRPDIAAAVRQFLSIEPLTERDIHRTHELAALYGWELDG